MCIEDVWEEGGEDVWEDGGEDVWKEEGGGEDEWEEGSEDEVKGMGKEEGEKWGKDELKGMGKNHEGEMKGKEKGKGACSFQKKYFHQDPQDDAQAKWSEKSI